jgi:hypothetical protein
MQQRLGQDVDGRVLGQPNGHGRPWQGSFRPNGPMPPLG